MTAAPATTKEPTMRGKRTRIPRDRLSTVDPRKTSPKATNAPASACYTTSWDTTLTHHLLQQSFRFLTK